VVAWLATEDRAAEWHGLMVPGPLIWREHHLLD
jgi:hypothetical protein